MIGKTLLFYKRRSTQNSAKYDIVSMSVIERRGVCRFTPGCLIRLVYNILIGAECFSGLGDRKDIIRKVVGPSLDKPTSPNINTELAYTEYKEVITSHTYRFLSMNSPISLLLPRIIMREMHYCRTFFVNNSNSRTNAVTESVL